MTIYLNDMTQQVVLQISYFLIELLTMRASYGFLFFVSLLRRREEGYQEPFHSVKGVGRSEPDGGLARCRNRTSFGDMPYEMVSAN
jgi:hypothetical protein